MSSHENLCPRIIILGLALHLCVNFCDVRNHNPTLELVTLHYNLCMNFRDVRIRVIALEFAFSHENSRPCVTIFIFTFLPSHVNSFLLFCTTFLQTYFQNSIKCFFTIKGKKKEQCIVYYSFPRLFGYKLSSSTIRVLSFVKSS